MNAFDLLSRPIQHYIYDKGWSQLRPIQIGAIERIMQDDRNYILCSRTASGKTEAAFLPILSKINLQRPGVRVLYISPLIALINDQFLRVEQLCQYLDIPVTKWHGEASRSKKGQLLKDPAGIVLITPESIEALFVNKPAKIKHLFGNLDYLVIDEIHSFLGADRGIHLQSLISRLTALQPTKHLPIVALSATIGDPQEAKYLTGNPENTAILIDKSAKTPEVRFKYFPDAGAELPSPLLDDLYTEVKDKKTLIFPNSRGRAEEVAVRLKRLAEHNGGHPYYFSHHSSVDKELRGYVEQFAKKVDAPNFSIACTSTLELGIDIGTVDLVAQIDATASIASLIQRVGRSGRREGATAQLLFYATRPWSLLQAMACWLLYTEGFIEPVAMDRHSFDLLFHQALSLIKEHSGLTRSDLIASLRANFAFRAIDVADINAILDHALATGLIELVGRELIIGLDGERLVNGREFYSVFQSEDVFKVIHAGNKIGELPLSIQLQKDQNILLAAKIWTIVYIDHKGRRVEVKPAPQGKKPAFNSAGGTVHPRIREKMLAILKSTEEYSWLDPAATDILAQLRHEFSIYPLADLTTNRPIQPTPHGVTLYTFTGTRILRTLSLFLKARGLNHELTEDEAQIDIHISSADLQATQRLLRLPSADLQISRPGSPDPSDPSQTQQTLLLSPGEIDAILQKQLTDNPSLLQFSKWGQYLPQPLQVQLLKNRYYDIPGATSFLETVQWVTPQ